MAINRKISPIPKKGSKIIPNKYNHQIDSLDGMNCLDLIAGIVVVTTEGKTGVGGFPGGGGGIGGGGCARGTKIVVSNSQESHKNP